MTKPKDYTIFADVVEDSENCIICEYGFLPIGFKPPLPLCERHTIEALAILNEKPEMGARIIYKK